MEGISRAPRLTFLRGDRLINVAGESHYQDALLKICRGATGDVVRRDAEALLVPEPDNPHDANAVMVRIEGRLVGYLPRPEALAYNPLIQGIADRGRTAACEALISGRGDRSGTPNLGVFLKLPPPEEG